jgi:hypothetical protein
VTKQVDVQLQGNVAGVIDTHGLGIKRAVGGRRCWLTATTGKM